MLFSKLNTLAYTLETSQLCSTVAGNWQQKLTDLGYELDARGYCQSLAVWGGCPVIHPANSRIADGVGRPREVPSSEQGFAEACYILLHFYVAERGLVPATRQQLLALSLMSRSRDLTTRPRPSLMRMSQRHMVCCSA